MAQEMATTTESQQQQHKNGKAQKQEPAAELVAEELREEQPIREESSSKLIHDNNEDEEAEFFPAQPMTTMTEKHDFEMRRRSSSVESKRKGLMSRCGPEHFWVRKLFYQIGRLIAACPSLAFALGVALALLSWGMFRIELKDEIRDGYTPENAPSREETRQMQEFWNSTDEPFMTILLIHSRREGANMLDLAHLRAAVRVQQFLLDQFNCTDEQGHTFNFRQLCGSQCMSIQMPLSQYVDRLSEAAGKLVSPEWKNRSAASELLAKGETLDYPLAQVHTYSYLLFLPVSIQIHLERMFFGVKLHKDTNNNLAAAGKAEEVDSAAAAAGLTPEQRLTNMRSVELLVLLFRADEPSSQERNRLLSRWQLAAADRMAAAEEAAAAGGTGEEQLEKEQLLQVHVVGTEILNREMLQEAERTLPFTASGFALMLAFVLANVLLTAQFREGRVRWARVLLSLQLILCPVLAITSTYGLLALAGQRINSFLLILPYLVLGIGVDDGFLLIHKWDKTGHIQNPRERLAFVLSEIGPSITVTTLTNVGSFAVGTAMPTPEVRIFCRGAAIAMALVYLLHLLLFCPALLWTASCSWGKKKKKEQAKKKTTIDEGGQRAEAKVEKKKKETADDGKKEIGGDKSPENGEQSVDNVLAQNKEEGNILDQELEQPLQPEKWPRAKACLDWLFAGYCSLLARPQCAGALILLLTAYWMASVWGAFFIDISLNTTKIIPPNSPLQASVKLLDRLVWSDFFPVTVLVKSPLDLSNRGQLDAFWAALDAFEQLPNYKGKDFSLVWLRDYQKYQNRPLASNKHPPAMDPPPLSSCRLEAFLRDPRYQHWSAFLRLNSSGGEIGCPRVEQCTLLLTFNQTGTWERRIQLILRLRQIAAEHSSSHRLKLVIWEQNALFVDQMLSLKQTTLETGLFTLCCMALICVFFTPNPFSMVISLLSISSICIGVFGQFYWLGFDLDPMVMAAFLMSIGLSVDFCAHIVYHFQFDYREEFVEMSETAVVLYMRHPVESRFERIKLVLSTVAWPILQSGLSTMLCICPLIAIQSYAGHVFVTTIFLVCTLGLAHGLVVLPSLLSFLPNCCTTAKIYNRLLAASMRQPRRKRRRNGTQN